MNAHHFPAVAAALDDGRVLADNAGGAQVPAQTIERMRAYLSVDNAQKGTPFERKERTLAMIAEAKNAAADLFGVARDTVGLGPNATSLAAAFARNLAHIIRPGDRIVVTATDHYANVAPWAWLTRFGAELFVVPVDARGDLDEAAYADGLSRGPVLVALPWASNATGTIFDLERYANAARDAGAIVVADGVQAAPHFRLQIPAALDFAMFSAYKIFAPHLGLFYVRPEAAERFFRSDDPYLPSAPINWAIETGTQSHEGWAGWLGTIDYLRGLGGGDARAAMDRVAAEEAELTRYTLAGFAARADRIVLYGRAYDAPRLPVFAFNIIGDEPAAIGRHLEAARIEASVGDYYAPRLMRALAPDFGNMAVRLSFAHYTTTADVDRCFAAIDARLAREPAVNARR